MLSPRKRYISSLSILLALTIAAKPNICTAQSTAGKLIMFLANKLDWKAIRVRFS